MRIGGNSGLWNESDELAARSRVGGIFPVRHVTGRRDDPSFGLERHCWHPSRRYGVFVGGVCAGLGHDSGRWPVHIGAGVPGAQCAKAMGVAQFIGLALAYQQVCGQVLERALPRRARAGLLIKANALPLCRLLLGLELFPRYFLGWWGSCVRLERVVECALALQARQSLEDDDIAVHMGKLCTTVRGHCAGLNLIRLEVAATGSSSNVEEVIDADQQRKLVIAAYSGQQHLLGWATWNIRVGCIIIIIFL